MDREEPSTEVEVGYCNRINSPKRVRRSGANRVGHCGSVDMGATSGPGPERVVWSRATRLLSQKAQWGLATARVEELPPDLTALVPWPLCSHSVEGLPSRWTERNRPLKWKKNSVSDGRRRGRQPIGKDNNIIPLRGQCRLSTEPSNECSFLAPCIHSRGCVESGLPSRGAT